MSRLSGMLAWDIRMQISYGIYIAGAVFTSVWILLLWLLPAPALSLAIPTIIFSDLAVTGFFFMGAVILLEKAENSIRAVIATPLTRSEYLLSKVLSLTVFLGIAALLIAGSTAVPRGVPIRVTPLIGSVLLGCMFFNYVGFIAVAPVRNFNQFIAGTVPWLTLLAIPLVELFVDIPAEWLRYLFFVHPTWSVLNLARAALTDTPLWEIVFNFAYLGAWVFLLNRIAERSFQRNLVHPGGDRS